jgi:hypothetical protein
MGAVAGRGEQLPGAQRRCRRLGMERWFTACPLHLRADMRGFCHPAPVGLATSTPTSISIPASIAGAYHPYTLADICTRSGRPAYPHRHRYPHSYRHTPFGPYACAYCYCRCHCCCSGQRYGHIYAHAHPHAHTCSHCHFHHCPHVYPCRQSAHWPAGGVGHYRGHAGGDGVCGPPVGPLGAGSSGP